MTKVKETRLIKVEDQARHTRALKDEAGNMIIEGYAAVFNQRSRLIFEFGEIFYEIIERNAFDDALAAEELDVLLTFQHNANEPLARLHKKRGVSTLELSVDDYGLKYRAKLNNTTVSRDTYERIQSGELFENSFVFSIAPNGERWERGEGGTPLRYVAKVAGLFDVSPVVNGAYANTDLKAAERSYKEFTAPAPDPQPQAPGPDYFQSFMEEWLELGN